jgi:intein/homing endonuclease
MSDFISDFISKTKKQFLKNRKYISDNDWSNIKDAENTKTNKENLKYKNLEFNLQNDLVTGVVDRIKYFIKKIEPVKKTKKAYEFINTSLEIIELHTNRVDFYINNVEISDIDNTELRSDEIAFHNHLFKCVSKIEDTISNIDIPTEEKGVDTSKIVFRENTKAPLSMHKVLKEIFTDIQKYLDEKGIDFDSSPKNEMHILNDKPPTWDTDLHYWEQDKEVLQYYVDEFKKFDKGIVIDGVYISGWAYFHLNAFVTNIPHSIWDENSRKYVNIDKRVNPPLRDSDWMIFENRVNQLKKDFKFMFLAATRRAAKTTSEASMLAHAATIGKRELLCGGASAKDLGQLAKNFKTHVEYVNPAFSIPNASNDWEKEVEIGIKRTNGKTIVLSTLFIVNTDGGNNKEIFAGFTPDVFVLDEAMKSLFLESLEGILPAMAGLDGTIRCFGVLSGCVCAGTKVWNNHGDLVNIEDLNPKKGILGFSVEDKKVSKEEITYWQPPHEKPCYRIETVGGRYLECSDDHPILTRDRYKSGDYKKTNTFIEAKNLKKGDSILVAEEIKMFGRKEMWNPRLVGLLIGDGSYGKDKTPVLSNCDKDVNNYIYNNFDAIEERSYTTKDGREYKETRIRNICQKLRELGIYGQTKNKKTLPLNIHSYTKKDICELLGGFYDADGHVVNDGKNRTINLSSSSKELMFEVKLLLQKLGIHGQIYTKKPSSTGIKGINNYYLLTIADKRSLLIFIESITFLIKYKQVKLEAMYEELKNHTSEITKDLKGLRAERIKSVVYIGKKPVYNLTAGTTHTYIANGIVTHNTGGSEALSADGLKCLNDPETYDILPMDWEVLERGMDEEDITWQEDRNKPFGTFIPGQCRVDRPKVESNLADYLGVKSDYLSKIKMRVTDWKKAKKEIEEIRDKVISDPIKHQKEIVYNPMKPSEIFMSGKQNRFPVAEAKAHKEYLLSTGLWDRRRELYRDGQGIIRTDISKKPLAEYPHRGGIIDAPALIFEDIPKEKPKLGTYTGGFDDYATEDSATDSVATFYVMKNRILGDPFSEKIVASISFRPDKHYKVHEQWLMLMEAYNLESTCFGENFNYAIKDFLDRRHLADKYLASSLDFTATFNIPNNLKRKTGWNPTTSKKTIFELFVDYCHETFEVEDEKGNIVTLKGVQRIDDIGLLDEIINWSENANVDRITSAMGAYAYIHYLNSSFKWKVTKYQREGEEKKEIKKKITREKSFYSTGRQKSFYNKRR